MFYCLVRCESLGCRWRLNYSTTKGAVINVWILFVLFHFQMARHIMYASPWRLAVLLTAMMLSVIRAVSAREAYFNGTTQAIINSITFPPISAHIYHLGFSFRSCGSSGTILSQVRWTCFNCYNELAIQLGNLRMKNDGRTWEDFVVRWVHYLMICGLKEENHRVANCCT